MSSLLKTLIFSAFFAHCARFYCFASVVARATNTSTDDLQQEPAIPGMPRHWQDISIFRSVYTTPGVPLSAPECYAAGSAAALDEGHQLAEHRRAYHAGGVTIEVPTIIDVSGEHDPSPEAVVWTLYFALETMSQAGNAFREAVFSVRERGHEGVVFAVVRFKKRERPGLIEDERGGAAKEVRIESAGKPGENSSLDEALAMAQIPSQIPGDWALEWSHRWTDPEPGRVIEPRDFYMSLVTMACILVTLPKDGPVTDFDTLADKYKVAVTDESRPGSPRRLTYGYIIFMGLKAVKLGWEKQRLGLLTLTLMWKSNGQEILKWVLRYPAPEPVAQLTAE